MATKSRKPATLAAALNQAMATNGWTQGELAVQLGVDPSRISRVLSGREGMAMTRVEALARVLGMPESEVAALVWEARRPAGQRPSTLGERVTNLENQLGEIGRKVDEMTTMVEQVLAARNLAGTGPGQRAARKSAATKPAASAGRPTRR